MSNSVEGLPLYREAGSPCLNAPLRSMEQVMAERRASALDKARIAVDRCESQLRGFLHDAQGDKEACGAIQSALDGLHDYGHEIHDLIEAGARDARIERLEQIDRELEAAHEHGLRSPAMTGRI